jgi:hypothetical protein
MLWDSRKKQGHWVQEVNTLGDSSLVIRFCERTRDQNLRLWLRSHDWRIMLLSSVGVGRSNASGLRHASTNGRTAQLAKDSFGNKIAGDLEQKAKMTGQHDLPRAVRPFVDACLNPEAFERPTPTELSSMIRQSWLLSQRRKFWSRVLSQNLITRLESPRVLTSWTQCPCFFRESHSIAVGTPRPDVVPSTFHPGSYDACETWG